MMMKLIIVVLIVIASTTCASDHQWFINEGNMELTFPSQTTVLTQQQELYNHTIWDSILKDVIHENKQLYGIESTTVIDYVKLRRDDRFAYYLNLLANWDQKSIVTIEDELALYINAYNAWAMHIVASNPCKIQFGRFCYPVRSIRDIGMIRKQVWDMRLAVVSGNVTTLNQIENHLRSLGYPQIHASIVCASASCPNLRREAFFPSMVLEQMNDQMKTFLTNPSKGMKLDKKNNKLSLSKIFQWYNKDFVVGTDNNNTTLIDYIIPYAPEVDREYLMEHRAYFEDKDISYLQYDWRLNQLSATNTILQI